MSGFKVEFSVLNLRATPGIYASSLATRPAAGQVGRVFIDTDNPSTGIYRDTGTTWVQIAETSISDIDTLQTVTNAGKTTTNDISVGHSGAPVSTVDIRKATAALNNASDWTLTANNTPTIINGASFGVNYVNALYGFQGLDFAGSATIGNAGLNSAGNFINRLGSTGAGTITVTQASTIRAIAGTHSGIYFNTAAASTFTHVAAIQTLQPINQGPVNVNVTNFYGVLIADSTPSSGAVTFTNRWGVYQEGANDNNYFSGNILVKSTTNNGNALQVTGNANITGNVGIGIIATTQKFEVAGDIGASPGSFIGSGLGYAGNTGASGSGYLQLYSATTGHTTLWNTGNFSMLFGTNNIERVRITSTGAVGIGTTAPNAAALLQMDSTTRGCLLPRMTDTQILAIVTPPNGLMAYSTTQNCPAFYDGTGWRKISHSAL